MRVLKKFTALLLSLLLLFSLAACGAKNEEGSIREGLYYEASGISPDAVLLTVNGRDVLAEQYFYWLCYTCDYVAGYLGEDIAWESAREEQTLGDYVKQEALRNTVLYAIVEQWAEKYDCLLTDEDKSAMEAEYNYYVDYYGGEEAYAKVLARMGTDKARAQALAGDYYLYSHLFDKFSEKGSALRPPEAELDAFFAQKDYITADHILLSTAAVADGDAAAKAALRKEAEALRLRLLAGEDFKTVAGACSDDKTRADYPDGYSFSMGSGVLEPDVEAAANALEIGALSEVIEAAEGFYLIKRLPLNRAAAEADYFDTLIASAQEAASLHFSALFHTIDPAAFFDRLTALRRELSQDAPTAAVPPASDAPTAAAPS